MEEEVIVKGFIIGGDDYIIKLFGVREFSVRVNVYLRREWRDKY